MTGWQEDLDRWVQAGVVDASTAERVHVFESQREAPTRDRWQVAVLLALGIILLVGGMMLFVASHWDDVNPWQRLSLVIGFLVAVHAVAAGSAVKFPGMATTLHGVGTAGAGAAILTVGTIFNMQEHWPTAVLVWAGCAGAGWWLLRDQVQQVLTLLLAAAWIVCEWSYRAEGYAHLSIYMARMDAVLAVVMLTCFFVVEEAGRVLDPVCCRRSGSVLFGWDAVGWLGFQRNGARASAIESKDCLLASDPCGGGGCVVVATLEHVARGDGGGDFLRTALVAKRRGLEDGVWPYTLGACWAGAANVRDRRAGLCRIGLLGSEGSQSGCGELRHRRICSDGDVVLCLKPAG